MFVCLFKLFVCIFNFLLLLVVDKDIHKDAEINLHVLADVLLQSLYVSSILEFHCNNRKSNNQLEVIDIMI